MNSAPLLSKCVNQDFWKAKNSHFCCKKIQSSIVFSATVQAVKTTQVLEFIVEPLFDTSPDFLA